MDLACMVDSAYSQANWSMARGSLATTASYASASPSVPASGPQESDQEGSATLAALDSLYTALSSLGFQQVQHRPGLSGCYVLLFARNTD
jgi:hypothetical protein